MWQLLFSSRSSLPGDLTPSPGDEGRGSPGAGANSGGAAGAGYRLRPFQTGCTSENENNLSKDIYSLCM